MTELRYLIDLPDFLPNNGTRGFATNLLRAA
jgi:hypothetical protein